MSEDPKPKDRGEKWKAPEKMPEYMKNPKCQTCGSQRRNDDKCICGAELE